MLPPKFASGLFEGIEGIVVGPEEERAITEGGRRQNLRFGFEPDRELETVRGGVSVVMSPPDWGAGVGAHGDDVGARRGEH